MRRALRFALIGVLGLILLVVITAGLAAVFVKPDEYKPQLIAAVKKATGRTLVLQGELSLSLFPGISVQAGPAELQGDAAFGPEPFLRVEKMRAGLELLPLLSGSVRISEIMLQGVRCNLVVTQTGRVSWEMAPPDGSGTGDVTVTSLTDGSAPARSSANPPDISIADLRLKDAVINYRHLGTGAACTLSLASFTVEDFASGRKSRFSVDGSFSDERRKQNAVFSLNGSVQPAASLDKPTAFAFSGKLDKTEFSGEGSAALRRVDGVAAPSLQGTFTLGVLDLDRYLTAAPSSDKAASSRIAGAQKTDDEEGVLRLLRHLELDLSLSADTVTVSKIPLRGIRAKARADKGQLVLSPCSLTVAEGLLNLDAGADARGKTLQAASNGTLRDLQVGQLLQALNGNRSVNGRLDLSWDITGTGASWPVLSRSLEGKAALLVTKALLPGFQIIPEGVPGIAGVRQDVVIAGLSGKWRISRGVASSNDILLQGPAVNAKASGRFDIPSRQMDYRVTVSLPALPEIPARVSGTPAAPSYTVDTAGLLRNTARDALQAPGKAGEGIRGLRNLLGRPKR